jgi:hypothetical protein
MLAGVLLIALGCSASSNSPMASDLGMSREKIANVNNTSHEVSWGTWEIMLDPATQTAQIVPLRTMEFTANVTQFMQPPASKKNLLSIAIDTPLSDFAQGHVVVDVSFTHPFPGLDTYTGFDVRGVCIGNGSLKGVDDSGIAYANTDELRVLNADGMTRWFNPAEFTKYGSIFGFTIGKLGTPSTTFTATLNGYKYFCDDLGKEDSVPGFFANPSCPNPRGFFSAGNMLTRRYDLQFSKTGGVPSYTFQYAVVAAWENPTVNPPTNIPEDFSLSANCQEAYAISSADQSTLFFESSTDKGGSLILDLTVYDHQGIQTSSVHDEIGRIFLESQAGLINGDLANFEGADLNSALVESNALFARYHFALPETQTNPWSAGSMPILVAVETANQLSYDSGFPGFAFPAGRLTSYIMTSINVGGTNPNLPPVAEAEALGSVDIYMGQSVLFDASASYDPDGTIVSYAWDSDDDGAYDDASGVNPSIKFSDPGTFHVDLKVTDDDGATDTLDTKITVNVSDKVIYVDDSNTTAPFLGTKTDPFQNIQEGIDAVTDDTGWMVYVYPGTYNPGDQDPDPFYSAGMYYVENKHNMTLFGEDGAVIDPPYWTNQVGWSYFRIRNGSTDITIDGFTFYPRYAYQSAVWCQTIDGITVKNCDLLPPNASYGILEFFRGENCSNVMISDSQMDTLNSPSTYMSLFVINGGSNVTITRNNVYNFNYWVGYNMGQTSEGYVAMYNVNGGEVSKNKFGGEHHRSADSSSYVESYGVYLLAGSNIIIRNNLIYDTYFYDSAGASSRNWGVRVESSATGIEIYNNTIERVGPPSTNVGSGWTYGIANASGTAQTIHSNIIANLSSPLSATCNGIYSGPVQSVDYGCVWNITGGIPSLYGGAASAGASSINLDPKFVDPATFDYHLATGSPCIGTGKDGVDMGCYGGTDPLN